MGDSPKNWDDLLLDLHLNRLEAGEIQELEQQVADSPELAAKSRGLRELLRLLDADATQPPADLADRVMAYIERQDRVIELPKVPTAVSGREAAGRGGRYGWRDLVAAAACLVLFFSVALPGYNKVRSAGYRSQCLNNLRAIAGAMDSYVQANAGYLPYDTYVPGASWLPTNNPNVPYASNTRHVFRIVAQGYVPNLRIFICPADPNGKPMTAVDLRKLQDFAQRCNNSYSFLFMNTPQGVRLQELQAGPCRQMVLIADKNPLQVQGAGPQQAGFPPGLGNSPLHDHGAGQNAVYTDGHGQWFTRPTIGVDSDDIYRAGNLDRYTGTEKPTAQTDTFLPP
jgi:hypothetical protein